MNENFSPIIVIGAGHAGIEAALAAARSGIKTLIFTMNLDAIGNMPCNPSVGGSAKGHLVFELDALGGEMGYAADCVTLQSRTLNLGKGSAVHSKRVQADRDAYRRHMKMTLEREKNLTVIQSEVVDILTVGEGAERRVRGVVTSLGETFYANRVIIAGGTYLESQIFVGDRVYSSGPDGMLASRGLSSALIREGIKLQRFKTGTPARVHRRSVDFSALELQDGEHDIIPFSVRTESIPYESANTPCHIVYTSADTHDIILSNLERSAMYSGNIVGTGPRYCPSIETKLVRFSDKPRHQLFVEPCGKDTEELYIQGFSTSMPTDIQARMLKSLPGFENAEIMRYAYAIEYDCAIPTQMSATLEFKNLHGLYGAGQFNGTSGYEEAAVQGLVAGINASLAERDMEPMILTRDSSYIGTLIDDLVTKGTEEPYRMMTSRSEYRLLLRQDNADVRLTEIGRRVGLIDDGRYSEYLKKRALTENEKRRIESTVIAPSDEVNSLLESHGSSRITTGTSLAALLRRPELSYASLSSIDKDRPELPHAVKTTAEIDIKYEGYIKRELAEAMRQHKLEDKKIPEDLDYDTVLGLRLEAVEKLKQIRPISIGQASRISGVNPADISVLLIKLADIK